jgi:protein ImuB
MVVCVFLPRFELVVAAADRSEIVQQALAGRALALAPLLGGERSSGRGGDPAVPAVSPVGRIGEVSGSAEACGVSAGMILGEALARCPDLVLVPPDPVGAAESWESMLRALESIGAAVEPARPGLAYFETDGLRGIHGTDAAAIDAARHACRSDRRGTRLGELGRPPRIGGGPTRFCALAAALAVRSRRPLLIGTSPTPPNRPTRPDREARSWLAGRPIEVLGFREETEALLEPLTRLGVRTLGELAKLGRPALADRFGAPGALAHRLACGEDTPLRVRRVEERLEESMEVGDASSGAALKGVLGVLVSRLLARPERRGRTLRAVTLSARLLSGGGWRERVVFRQALSDPERIWMALSLRLLLLPAPAAALRLSVASFGPPGSEQGAFLDEERVHRAARLRNAIAQVRAVAGADAALRAVCVDPHSRVPERRMMLAPIPE